MNIIDINHVSKTYGKGNRRVRAVDALDLHISSGQVFGFLGPNGAGKSTTIRMMLGLIRPTGGQISLFGQDVREQTNGVQQTGAMVENAVFYHCLTGRENLKVLGLSIGHIEKNRIDRLLSKVGMLHRANRKVSDYSTGMKQRLGIAAALLSDPALVILDEPTNGLDPAGIIEVRDFIRSLAVDEGKTVFLSSHLLTEVEQVCDRVAIINRGRLVREGSIPSLLSETGAELHLQVSERGRAAELLQDRWEAHNMDQPEWLRVKISPTENSSLVGIWGAINVFPLNVFGRMLPLAFMAVVFAGEFQWQTWRLIIPTTSRTRLVLAKWAALTVTILFAFTLTGLITVLLQWVAHALIGKVYGPALTLSNAIAALQVFGQEVLIATLSLLLLGTFAAVAAFITRSTVGSLLLTFGFSLAELLSIGLLAVLASWFERPAILDVYRYMPNFNLENLRSWLINGYGLKSAPFELVIEAGFFESVLIVVIWIVVFGFWAISFFKRIDITK